MTHQRSLPKWIWHEHQERYRFASKFVQDRVVIDCASGEGFGAASFAEAGAAEVFCVDLCYTSVHAARDRMTPDTGRFIMSSATHLPFIDEFADVYISLETIEHLEDDRTLLSEAARVLKRDGVFICSTPNRVVTNPASKLHERPFNPHHVREYDQREFQDLLGCHFGSVELFGQNRRSGLRVALMQQIGRIFSTIVAVRINQVFKLLGLPFEHSGKHSVLPTFPGSPCEYYCAVCRDPITTNRSGVGELQPDLAAGLRSIGDRVAQFQPRNRQILFSER